MTQSEHCATTSFLRDSVCLSLLPFMFSMSQTAKLLSVATTVAPFCLNQREVTTAASRAFAHRYGASRSRSQVLKAPVPATIKSCGPDALVHIAGYVRCAQDAACLQRHAGMIIRGVQEAVPEADDVLAVEGGLRNGKPCAGRLERLTQQESDPSVTKETTVEISRSAPDAMLAAERANAILIAGRPLLFDLQGLPNEDPRHG